MNLETNNTFFSPTKIALLCFALSFAATLLIDPVWGFYDSFMALLASGSLSGVFFHETYHLGLSPMSFILTPLHKMLPQLPWLAIIVFSAWIFVQTVIIFFISSAVGKNSWRLKHFVAAWIILFLIVFAFSFTEFSITGIAMLLSFVSTLGIWLQQKTHKQKDILFIFIMCIGIAGGYALRMESGIGGTLFAGIWIVISDRKIINWIKALALPVIVSSLLLLRYELVVRHSEFFSKVEPLVFYVTDSKNQPQYIAKDSVDEMKIEIIRASCLIDSAALDFKFYSQLAAQKNKYEKKLVLSPQHLIKQIAGVIYPTLITNRTFTLITFFVLFLSFYAAKKQKNKSAIKKLFAFNAAAWFIVLFLAYSMKMEQWHYVPLLQIIMLGNILFASENLFRFITKNFSAKTMLVVVLCGMFLYHFGETINNHRSVNEKIMALKSIEKNYGNSLLFFDVNTRELLDDYAFRFYTQKRNIFFYDMAQMNYLKEYENYLNSLCNCDAHNPVSFFNYMKGNSSNIIYISTKPRVELLSNYMKTVYKLDVNFKTEASSKLSRAKYVNAVTSFSLYRIE